MNLREAVTVLGIATFVWLLLQVVCNIVGAQEATAEPERRLTANELLALAHNRGQPNAVLLARTCWSEAGNFDGVEFANVEDCAAIALVLLNSAATHGTSFRVAWATHSRRLAEGSPDRERPWLAYLNAHGSRPLYWDLRWWTGSWRNRWLALVELCERILAGEVTSSCVAPESVIAWGSTRDVRRGDAREGCDWFEVECGDTHNHFGHYVCED